MRALHTSFALLGASGRLPKIKHLVYHWQARVLVWPSEGLIYGGWGKPIGQPCSDGYVRVSRGDTKHQYAHRIIWEAVNGPIPPDLEIDHVNGKRNDNRISNLDLVTRRENTLRAVDRGLQCHGRPHPNAKLTPDLVCEIRASDRPTRAWARELDLDAKSVRDARRGTTWRHVVCRGSKAVQTRRSRRRRRQRPAPGVCS